MERVDRRLTALAMQKATGPSPLSHRDSAFTLWTYVGRVDEGLGDAAFLD